MADIYDNSPERKFVDGLRKTITTNGVKRVDFCVGYFNLRGWDQIADQVDLLEGEQVREIDATMQRPVMVERKCRLLIGMYRPDEEIIRELYSCHEVEPLDTEHLLRYKMKVAEDFRRQLTIGVPSNADEQTIRHLAGQLREGRVCVKLYLRQPLHAKLYLAYRNDDKFGYLTVIKDCGMINGKHKSQCQCDCGNIIYVNNQHLKSGHTQSCGCKTLSRGVEKIKNLLNENNIPFIQEYTFSDLYSPKKCKLRFDFAIFQNQKLYELIEFDGLQHFQPMSGYYEGKFKQIQQYDKIKNEYCKKNNIKLIRIPYYNENNINLELLQLTDYLLEENK